MPEDKVHAEFSRQLYQAMLDDIWVGDMTIVDGSPPCVANSNRA